MSILSEITKHIELPEGPSRQKVLEKFVRKAVKMEDALWNGLSEKAQLWLNASVDQIKAEKAIEDPEPVEEKAQPVASRRAVLDELPDEEDEAPKKAAPKRKKAAKKKIAKKKVETVKVTRKRTKGKGYHFVTAMLQNPECNSHQAVLERMPEVARPAVQTAGVLWYDLSLIRSVMADLGITLKYPQEPLPGIE